MAAPDNPKRREEQIDHERRSANRTRDDADWESKVVGRLGGRLRNLPVDGEEKIGWETSVLDTLRRRIERGPS